MNKYFYVSNIVLQYLYILIYFMSKICKTKTWTIFCDRQNHLCCVLFTDCHCLFKFNLNLATQTWPNQIVCPGTSSKMATVQATVGCTSVERVADTWPPHADPFTELYAPLFNVFHMRKGGIGSHCDINSIVKIDWYSILKATGTTTRNSNSNTTFEFRT